MLADYEREFQTLQSRIAKMRSFFDIPAKKKMRLTLEETVTSADFWKTPELAKKHLQELEALRSKIENFEKLEREASDLEIFFQVAGEDDPESIREVRAGLENLSRNVSASETGALLSGEYDWKNAILAVHSGAGGTDAQDWVEMLLRMYLRWAERSDFKTKLVDVSPGEEAGIKSATVIVTGPQAYGYLKAEKGVHRLVRLSPFDAAHRRHTSFAQVEVLPEIDDDIKIEINPEDLKIDTYRSSGAGGQHVNKTDSAVRITHLPTGIIVSCQNERSQHSNRLTAMRVLKARLFEREREEQGKKISQLKGEHRDIAWGSQIRSYVIHPYSQVKDHRTGFETGNTQAVLDGEIGGFIRAYLEYQLASRESG
ncbi:MAG: peptide chain release factor 2 [bacterium]